MKTLLKKSSELSFTLIVILFLAASISVRTFANTLKNIRIGVLAKRGTERCLEKWNPTAEYLSQQIPDCQFVIVPLGYGDVFTAVEQEKVDFILANPSYYVALEMKFGASRIATLKNLTDGEVNAAFGGVLFARSDRQDISSFSDFGDKSFMTVHPNALGAWHSVWLELEAMDFDPFEDFSAVRFAGSTHDSVVYAVKAGIIDMGAVRTGTLERMAQEQKISLDEFRVFHFYDREPENMPILVSTRLYPEWPVAKLKNTSWELAEKVTSALLRMSPADSAALTAGYGGWTIPLNYQSVHQCLKTLRTGPYEEFDKVTFRAVFRHYWHWMLLTVILGTAIILFALYVSRLNHKLRRAVTAMRESGRKRNEAIRLAEETARLASIGVMAAGITHEINQPLNAIRLSADGIILWNENNPGRFPEFLLNLIREISDGSKRISVIIERMRSFWSTPADRKNATIDLNKAVHDALELMNRQIQNHQIKLDLHLSKTALKVLGDSVQLQQIINNIIVNAIHALDEVDRNNKRIRISTRLEGQDVMLQVSDNGPGLPTISQDELFNPFYSTRNPGKGMGLGLAIVKMFVDRFDGKIEASDNKEGGATFTIHFQSVTDRRED